MTNRLLKFQKILRFVPYINFLTCFFWLYVLAKNEVPVRTFIKKMLFLMVILLIITIPRIVIDLIFPNTIYYSLIFHISTLVQLYVIAFVVTKHQEIILSQNKTD